MTREEAANILSNDIIDGHVEGNARFMDAFWFAVDNLKDEHCDAVSREAALKAFEELPHEYKTKEQRARTGGIAACQFIVRELPSVTPKQMWIPVSERLPEEDGCYLVTTTGTNNDIIDIAYYTEEIWHKASRIKAWMPLPEPYKAESEDKE